MFAILLIDALIALSTVVMSDDDAPAADDEIAVIDPEVAEV